ncbi:hypothetical protein [Flavobacterium sp. TSSA_36]|uniref:hypothetical protein n=1 Tax=Flavobacterium sp. TSSA_36 TaxID=3447669 RepID=UPI003F35E0CE
MKVRFLFILALFTSFSFAQSINDFKAVIVPLKYDFQKKTNEYRLATLTKFNLNKAGFEVFYTEESNPYDKCNLLYIDVINVKAFLATKMYFVLKDCNGKEIFKSTTGYTKEKEYQLAYTEALNEAFTSLYAQNYKYNGTLSTTTKTPTTIPVVVNTPTTTNTAIETNSLTNTNIYYAQPTSNGYQLVDTTPKVIMKIYKTSKSDYFTAIKEGIQGVLLLKDKDWYFEYYQNEQLFSEKMNIKF